MKKHIILILFLGLKLFFTQNYVVKDSITKQPIPFVKCTLKENEKTISYYSDQNGVFFLTNENAETIEIACMGYKTKMLSKKNLQKEIFLAIQPNEIEEVVITNSTKKRTIGNLEKKARIRSYYGGTPLEAAFFIDNEINKPVAISGLKVWLSCEGYKTTYFRVHLYKKDANGNPGEKIPTANNLFTFNKKIKSKCYFDLSESFMVLPKEGAFISLEIVDALDEDGISLNQKSLKKERIKSISLISFAHSGKGYKNHSYVKDGYTKGFKASPDEKGKNLYVKGGFESVNFIFQVDVLE